jgi:WD40 repeat protein
VELYDRRQTKFISAHNGSLASICLSIDGKRLATASEKGTLVRVWNTADGLPLQVRHIPHTAHAFVDCVPYYFLGMAMGYGHRQPVDADASIVVRF